MTPTRTAFDFSKITGLHSLLALFLIVVEGLLGFWLAQAEGAVERSVAGAIMAAIFMAFLFVVSGMSKRGQVNQETYAPQGINAEFDPAREEVTEEAIKAQPLEEVVAPDASFSIHKPPDDWKAREITMMDWLGELNHISDPELRQKMFAGLDQDKVLDLKSSKQATILPIPGKTRMNGSKIPSALWLTIPTQLTIFRMARAQPPLFMERSLADNILTLVGQIATPGLWATHGITSSATRSGRDRLLIEFYQDLDDCLIDGVHRDSARNNLVVIGIKGELHDHLLLMRYLSLPEQADPRLDADLRTLRSLVDSFRPLRIANAVEKHTELRKDADDKFQTLMEEGGEAIFYGEMRILAFRMKGWNFDSLEDRRNAITWLKPFEMLAEEVGLDEPRYNQLWIEVKRAEQGEAAEFKTLLSEIIDEFTEDSDDEADALDKPDYEALELLPADDPEIEEKKLKTDNRQLKPDR